MVDVNTKKKWLTELFPGIDWNKGEICRYCYSDFPSWSPRGEHFIERCDYCDGVKYGGTIAPWEIPDDELERLIKERIWR